ncbi:MAG: DUF1127 domain-containing protein [Pseudomonadota bacterium]
MLIISQIARAYDAVRTHFENAAAARQLHAMTDYELRDIGMSRDQIDRLVYGRDTEAEATEIRPVFKRPAFGFAQLT